MNNQIRINPVISKSSVKSDYISYKFDELLPGNGFIIQNDKDPLVLYNQLLLAKGDAFSWEYLEVGPRKWCIKISKLSQGNALETLGEMAVSDQRKALILRKYALDFSFNGKKTLKEACAEKGISIRNVERDLNATGKQSLVYTINYNSWELDYLADFIETNHHEYTRKTLLCIANEYEKFSKQQSDYPDLQPLFKVFKPLHANLLSILLLEEQVLFPCIRFLVQLKRGKVASNTLRVGSITDHIKKIASAHQDIGKQMEYIRDFTGNYTLPEPENSVYSQLIQWLNEFDNDLHEHVHIENNILFPKAIKLEQQYSGNARLSCSTFITPGSSIDYQSAIL